MTDTFGLFGKPKDRRPFSQYVAAALIEAARGFGEVGIACPVADLAQHLSKRFSVDVDAEEIADAIEILEECSTAYLAKDPLAGTFVAISYGRFQNFIRATSSDKERYDSALAAAGDDSNAYFYAEEETPTPSWDVMRRYKVIESYSEFGAPFIDAAMSKFESIDFATRLASGENRIVSFEDNMPIVEQIRVGLNELRAQIRENNEVGDALGDNKQEVIAEIDSLATAMNAKSARAGFLLSLSRKTLTWIGNLVAKTSIEELVKHISKLFIQWLS
jgi:hypothetical protein